MPLFLTLLFHFLLALRTAAQEEGSDGGEDDAFFLASEAAAPSSTPSPTTTQPPRRENATVRLTEDWPVATLWLPISDPGGLAASIISTVHFPLYRYL